MRYIVNKCLLSKPDKWPDDAEGRHEKSATCLNKLHMHKKKKKKSSYNAYFRLQNPQYEVIWFLAALNAKSILYHPPPPQKKERKKKVPNR